MKVTLKWLEKRDACRDQRVLFQETFGEEAEVTLRNLKKAEKAGLSLDWFVGQLSKKKQKAIESDPDYNKCYKKFMNAECGSDTEEYWLECQTKAYVRAIAKVVT